MLYHVSPMNQLSKTSQGKSQNIQQASIFNRMREAINKSNYKILLKNGHSYLPYSIIFHHQNDTERKKRIKSAVSIIGRNGRLKVGVLSATGDFRPQLIDVVKSSAPNNTVDAWLEATGAVFNTNKLAQLARDNNAILANRYHRDPHGRTIIDITDPVIRAELVAIAGEAAASADGIVIDDNFGIPPTLRHTFFAKHRYQISNHSASGKAQYLQNQVHSTLIAMTERVRSIAKQRGKTIPITYSMSGWQKHALASGVAAKYLIDYNIIQNLDIQLYDKSSVIAEHLKNIEWDITSDLATYQKLDELRITVNGYANGEYFSDKEKQKQLKMVKEFQNKMKQYGINVLIGVFNPEGYL